MQNPEEGEEGTPRRAEGGDKMATARTPNDYNRGVQNATEVGLAESKRLLGELEEVRAVQRRELAELVASEFADLYPNLASQPLRRGEDAFDQVLSRLKTAVQEDKFELRDMREAAAEARRDRRGSNPEQVREIQALRDQIAESEGIIKRLQEMRTKEAQVIAEWQKDILLSLRNSESSRPLHQEFDRPPTRRQMQYPARYAPREFESEDDEYDYEYAPPPRSSRRRSVAPKVPSWRVREERLLEVLEQGEKIYNKIMETSMQLKRRIAQE